jgi:hypothetical protein
MAPNKWTGTNKIIGAIPVAHEDCFIKVSNLVDCYLHLGKTPGEYIVQKGKNGAAIWRLREALAFIKVNQILDLAPEMILPMSIKK